MTAQDSVIHSLIELDLTTGLHKRVVSANLTLSGHAKAAILSERGVAGSDLGLYFIKLLSDDGVFTVVLHSIFVREHGGVRILDFNRVPTGSGLTKIKRRGNRSSGVDGVPRLRTEIVILHRAVR